MKWAIACMALLLAGCGRISESEKRELVERVNRLESLDEQVVSEKASLEELRQEISERERKFNELKKHLNSDRKLSREQSEELARINQLVTSFDPMLPSTYEGMRSLILQYKDQIVELETEKNRLENLIRVKDAQLQELKTHLSKSEKGGHRAKSTP